MDLGFWVRDEIVARTLANQLKLEALSVRSVDRFGCKARDESPAGSDVDILVRLHALPSGVLTQFNWVALAPFGPPLITMLQCTQRASAMPLNQVMSSGVATLLGFVWRAAPSVLLADLSSPK